MSWLARSIANTLRLDDDEEEVRREDGQVVDLNFYDRDGGGDDDDDDSDEAGNEYSRKNDAEFSSSSKFDHRPIESLDLEDVDLEDRDSEYNKISEIDTSHDYDGENDGADYSNQGRGVKEDLSEFTETLTRQLWGMASFLAPPPPPPPLPRRNSNLWDRDRRIGEVVEASNSGDEESYNGEDYGSEDRFREFSQSFLHIGMPEPEEEDIFEDAVGITQETLDFAEDAAHHPETWLNFPLSEEEEFEDFEISHSQHQHARAIEHLTPRLAALRRELCPVHMTEGYFWMVYFVLLHSRLNKHDNDLLSTPQLVKARAMWMHELQKQSKPESDWLGRYNYHPEENIDLHYQNLDPSSFEDTQRGYASEMAFPLQSIASQLATDSETEKQPHEYHEIHFIDKSVLKEDLRSTSGKEPLVTPSFKVPIQEYDEHEDDWLDDDSDLEGYVGAATLINEEDVSFSDLEDDIDCNMPIKSNVAVKD